MIKKCCCVGYDKVVCIGVFQFWRNFFFFYFYQFDCYVMGVWFGIGVYQYVVIGELDLGLIFLFWFGKNVIMEMWGDVIVDRKSCLDIVGCFGMGIVAVRQFVLFFCLGGNMAVIFYGFVDCNYFLIIQVYIQCIQCLCSVCIYGQ